MCWVQEIINKGVFSLKPVASADNLADIGTKNFPAARLLDLSLRLRLRERDQAPTVSMVYLADDAATINTVFPGNVTVNNYDLSFRTNMGFLMPHAIIMLIGYIMVFRFNANAVRLPAPALEHEPHPEPDEQPAHAVAVVPAAPAALAAAPAAVARPAHLPALIEPVPEPAQVPAPPPPAPHREPRAPSRVFVARYGNRFHLRLHCRSGLGSAVTVRELTPCWYCAL